MRGIVRVWVELHEIAEAMDDFVEKTWLFEQCKNVRNIC